MTEEPGFLQQWGALIAAPLAGVIGALLASLPAFRRAKVDENGAVLGSWKDMVAALNERIDEMAEEQRLQREEQRQEREDNAALRQRLRDIEGELAKERRERREEVETLQGELKGLRANFIQNSRSAVAMIGEQGKK